MNVIDFTYVCQISLWLDGSGLVIFGRQCSIVVWELVLLHTGSVTRKDTAVGPLEQGA
uniref:Uncharacterized protein n=1 Tax=Anguilla anguilla TaxID=7936 RepID=A0A0E9V5P6_ANGAN